MKEDYELEFEKVNTLSELEFELKFKVNKYRELTKEALQKIELMPELIPEQKKIALDFLSMAKNYFNDAKHFEKENELLTALAAYSYAHAWLDAGVRAKLFNAKEDDQLFTLP
ncbi:MAG: DUF357 domain-containing protein [Candidatus Diapherotrites archaeon]